MKFEIESKETVMLNPLKEMARRSIKSEIRRDPLTGRTARVCHFMKLQWDKPDFDAMVAGTEKYCPFCGDTVFKITPCFPEEIVPEGRLTRDDLVLFPNLAPYDCISAVAILGGRHYIPMTEISARRMEKGFALAMELFQRLDAAGHPESVYHLINWNYMPASGSSLIHPHLQVFATATAPNLMREELEAAAEYTRVHGSNFWDDLVALEREGGKRFLGTIGRTQWLSVFAPMGVAGDVMATVDGVTHTLELTDNDLADLAAGLVRVMAAYDKMGIYNFNMNFFTGARGDDHYRFHLVFSPRSFFNQALGTPDVGALRNLYNETLCMAFPEEINAMLKPDFK